MEAEIGILGGSGFYALLENAENVEIETEYGKPSDAVSIGTIGDKKVAFIPRHGLKHTLAPHKVPYRANIEAFNSLGVKRVIGTAACGSLKRDFRIGQIVFFDQLVNMAYGRQDTFFDGDQVAHISTAEPYCSGMRARASSTASSLSIDHRDEGCVVVVGGPRFSTKAESRFFAGQGFGLINMTQYPEVVLARERAMCYLGVGVVTDYDAGIMATEGIAPVENDDVLRIFSENVGKVKSLINELINDLPKDRKCNCGSVLDGAMMSKS